MNMLIKNKRYGGYIWCLIFAGLFIGLSLLFLSFTEGVTWYLISTTLRVVFGVAILLVSTKLYEKKPLEIICFKNTKEALLAGSGFLLFFLYYVIAVITGFGKITGLTTGILLSRVLFQQASTGFYEELNYRFLLLEGAKYTKNTIGMKTFLVLASAVFFGLIHCVTGWSTYTFLQTGAIGFAFAVIFVKSGNILIPMILHFLYDVIANMAPYVEWDHNPVFESLSSMFDIMLVIMFVASAVILLIHEKKELHDYLS